MIQVGETLDGVEATLLQVRNILASGRHCRPSVGSEWRPVAGWSGVGARSRCQCTARRITVTADFGQRLPGRRRRDEVGELVETFNALITRVEATLAEQQRFLADTSHELRSPLTVIRANLGFLRRELGPRTRAECVREAEAEAQRMGRLIGDLLLLGQAESSELLRRTPLAIADLILEVAEQARVQATDRTIEVEPLRPVMLNGDRDRLKQVVWNLVENALRYTPPGGAIRLSAVQEADQIVIAVSDEGPGIAPEHIPHLFDRFYRVDRARSRATGGAGLGLAIVQHLVKAHGGSVAVQSLLGKGTTFTLRLPGVDQRASRCGAARPTGSKPGPTSPDGSVEMIQRLIGVLLLSLLLGVAAPLGVVDAATPQTFGEGFLSSSSGSGGLSFKLAVDGQERAYFELWELLQQPASQPGASERQRVNLPGGHVRRPDSSADRIRG